jgi:hypothetical protein
VGFALMRFRLGRSEDFGRRAASAARRQTVVIFFDVVVDLARAP